MAREHRFTCDACGFVSPWSTTEKLPAGWAVLTAYGQEIPGAFPVRPVRALEVCSAACACAAMAARQIVVLNQSPPTPILEAADDAAV